MILRVLGSSGSVAPGQNTAAFLIDDSLLLDAGTLSLSLNSEAQNKISHLLLTHAHLDHVKGLPFLLDNRVLSHQELPLTVLSGREVLADLKRHLFNNRIWPDFNLLPSRERPILRYQTLSTRSPIRIGGYTVQTTRVTHSVPAYGYSIEDDSGAVLVYTGDTGPTQRIWQRMRGRRIRALIIEVSFPNALEGLALSSGHLTPALLKNELLKMPALPKRIYITHPKHPFRETIERELDALQEKGIEMLEDGSSVAILS